MVTTGVRKSFITSPFKEKQRNKKKQKKRKEEVKKKGEKKRFESFYTINKNPT